MTEEKGLVVVDALPVSPDKLHAQVQAIQQSMAKVMKEGTHYGKVPGCGDKPTLLKPGAEKIGLMFRLLASFDVQLHELPGNHREFSVVCSLKDINGNLIGQGVGSCSTMESKYRYRNAEMKCPVCGCAAIKRSKYPPKCAPAGTDPGWYCYNKIGGCGMEYEADDERITKQPRGKVENPDIADQYNTVLKIAKKRAHVDAILTCTAASDIFTQDLEDIDPEQVAPPPSNGKRPSAPPAEEPPFEREPEPHTYDISGLAPDRIPGAIKHLKDYGAKQAPGFDGVRWVAPQAVPHMAKYEVTGEQIQ